MSLLNWLEEGSTVEQTNIESANNPFTVPSDLEFRIKSKYVDFISNEP